MTTFLTFLPLVIMALFWTFVALLVISDALEHKHKAKNKHLH